MENGLSVLPRAKLQGLIDEELIRRLEIILPLFLDSTTELLNVYKRENLAKIADIFVGEQVLKNEKTRKLVLQHQPPEIIDKLLNETGTITEGESFNLKVDALVKRGWIDIDFIKKFVSILRFSDANIPLVQSVEETEEIIARPLTPFKSLKEYQMPVYSEASRRLEIPRNRFIIQMPTGSGKTRVAMEIVTQFLNSSGNGEKVIWLANSSELCEQASAAFREIWEHIGIYDVKIYRVWGKKKITQIDENYRSVVICGFDKLYSMLKSNKSSFDRIKRNANIVVIDEAHKAIAPTYKETIKALLSKNTKVVGLTATPGRSASIETENLELSEFFFGSIVGISNGKEDSVISLLRKRKVLAEVKYHPLITGRTYSLSNKEQYDIEKMFDFPKGFLSKIGNDDIRNIEILKRVQEEAQKGKLVLLFACSVNHSKFLSSCLNYIGVKSGHVDGEVGYGKRRSIINDFRNENLQVLCNYGVLSTGFDVPKIDVVFITRPTNSVVLYSQMIGRGLRGPTIGGTELCTIVDVKDNIIGYSSEDRVYNYFSEYWE